MSSCWLKGKDGSENFLRFWQAKNPQACVLYLHGIEGHSLWFEDTALFLAENGVTTFAVDRRGSGESKEARGDMQSWKQLLDDLKIVLQFTKEQAADLPLFLMANCWGAKLAALIAQDDLAEARMLRGMILSSPAIEVKVDLKFSQKLQVAWRLLSQNRRPMPIPLTVNDFTNNPIYLDFISKDQKRLSEASAQFFFNTFLLTHMSKSCAEKIKLPTLILQSGIDTIVDEAGIKKWFERLGASDKDFQYYPGVHHSLDFDAEPETYRRNLLGWIQNHSNQLASINKSQDSSEVQAAGSLEQQASSSPFESLKGAK